jgi:hypothetical protein
MVCFVNSKGNPSKVPPWLKEVILEKFNDEY